MSIEAISALTNANSVTQTLTASPGAQLGQIAGAGQASVVGGASVGAAGGPSFTDALKTAAQSAFDTVAAGEKAAQAGALGQASLHEVVHSVVAAELTVQAVTSIRDKAVQAYQELLRMPV